MNHEHTPALELTNDRDQATDYRLREDAPSCWIEVDGIALYIIRTPPGVLVMAHHTGREGEDPINEMWVTPNTEGKAS
jgi:hypothetical protein